MKHIHILGICGTFMGSLAIIARQLGYHVTGCDTGVYPPMSTYLESQGIEIIQGFDVETIKQLSPDEIIVGNAMKRGNPVIEWMLSSKQPLISGPAWLSKHVLLQKQVLAVAGTHGKTTTTSILAWILEYAGKNPSFLIGGIAENFAVSSRLTDSDYFVIEADEYDTGFFDKRSKFVHYRPDVAILNNIEFDHADIFHDIADIKRQFTHLLKVVSANGAIIANGEDTNVSDVLNAGVEAVVISFGDNAQWHCQLIAADGSEFTVLHEGKPVASVSWHMLGKHNVMNALAAIVAANHIGITPEQSAKALNKFSGIKRRLEVRGCVNGVTVYDDFAHHPTAIAHTIEALQAKVGSGERVIAIIEPRSNTMKNGAHAKTLPDVMASADHAHVYASDAVAWDIDGACNLHANITIHHDFAALLSDVLANIQPKDHLLVMSNGGFEGIHDKLLMGLRTKCKSAMA